MPSREEPFYDNDVYHIYNKTIDKKTVFKNEARSNSFLEHVRYYRSTKATLSFSKLKVVTPEVLRQILQQVSYKKYFQADINAYCLMPTHFHFLITQKVDGGICNFMSYTLNSFTRYMNIKQDRLGPIFLPRFKAKRIKTDEELMHVSRYIHLNPYSSGIVSTIEQLIDYPWSSFGEYLYNRRGRLSDDLIVLNLFNKDRERYRKFVLKNADYQKTLEYVKLK